MNTINGDCYVGRSANIEGRWTEHRYWLKRGDHKNPHLQSAWNAYGAENFRFHILEEVTDADDIQNREQFYIDTMPSRYNIWSAERGARVGTAMKPETKARIREKALGRKATEEAKERMRQAKLGRKLSPESIEKRSAAYRGKKLRPKTEQEKAIWRKLMPDQVRELRALYASGLTMMKLAARFQIGFGTVQRILSGQSYRSVE